MDRFHIPRTDERVKPRPLWRPLHSSSPGEANRTNDLYDEMRPAQLAP